MNLFPVMNQILLGLSSMCLMSTVQAGVPVWSFSPIGSPVVSVSATGTASVQYTITNNSKKPHRLVLSSKTAAGISQSGGPCLLAAKSPATPNPTCTLTLSINGGALPANNLSGGPYLCQTNTDGTPNANQCYQPSSNDILVITRTTAPGATTLSTSIAPPSMLALSVKDPLNPALTGNARQITIENTGINEATGVSIAYPSWPGGTPATTASSTCGATLAAGATCTITVTPGTDATSSCTTGIAPTPGAITVSGTNVATPATSDVVVLSYGCQYQGGFLYSVDDTTNNGVTGTCTTPTCTKSIGGKVVSLVDQAPRFPDGIVWSSNGGAGGGSGGFNPVDISYDTLPGIDNTSTSSAGSPTSSMFNTFFSDTYTNTNPFLSAPLSMCDGGLDGSCNTNNIVTFYNQFITNNTLGSGGSVKFTASAGPTNSAYYAAGLCKQVIEGYSDWYLPAICEMGPESNGSGCAASTQNIISGFPALIGDPNAGSPGTSCTIGTNCLAGHYWSSTQDSLNIQAVAWVEDFSTGGSNELYLKNAQLGVRCSRALNP